MKTFLCYTVKARKGNGGFRRYGGGETGSIDVRPF